MPNGAIIVKENYTADGASELIAIMDKVRGYNPDNNDWLWAKVSASGEV